MSSPPAPSPGPGPRQPHLSCGRLSWWSRLAQGSQAPTASSRTASVSGRLAGVGSGSRGAAGAQAFLQLCGCQRQVWRCPPPATEAPRAEPGETCALPQPADPCPHKPGRDAPAAGMCSPAKSWGCVRLLPDSWCRCPVSLTLSPTEEHTIPARELPNPRSLHREGTWELRVGPSL